MANVGIIGLGTIGSGVVEQLKGDKEIKIVKLVDSRKERDVFGLPFSTDVNDVLENKEVDIVVELIGGYNPAYEFIKKALENGKHVVTANKAVIDKYGAELNEIAIKNKVYLFFEAAVCGGIPIINALKFGAVGNNTKTIMGILNGTTNYILTRMGEGLSYKDALKEAQQKGFAEKDPSFDVEGKDAAQKLAILASINFGCKISSEEIYKEGITKLTKNDLYLASRFDPGYKIKLIAAARIIDSRLNAWVRPALVIKTHDLAKISYEMNGVYLEGNAHLLFAGEGAGSPATPGAVVSDIRNIAKRIGKEYGEINWFDGKKCQILSTELTDSRFFVAFDALHVAGVFAKIATALADFGVNIAKVVQDEKHRPEGEFVPLAMVTERTELSKVEAALRKIGKDIASRSCIMPVLD